MNNLHLNVNLLNYHFSSADSPISKPKNALETKLLAGLPEGWKLFRTPGVQRGDFLAPELLDVYRIEDTSGSFCEFVFQWPQCQILMFALPVSLQGKFGVARKFFRGCCDVVFSAGIQNVYGHAKSNAQPLRKVKGRDWRDSKTANGETRLSTFYARLGLRRMKNNVMVLHHS